MFPFLNVLLDEKLKYPYEKQDAFVQLLWANWEVQYYTLVCIIKIFQVLSGKRPSFYFLTCTFKVKVSILVQCLEIRFIETPYKLVHPYRAHSPSC